MAWSGEWSRRRFVRTLVLGSAASAVVGRPWSGALVASVTAAPQPGDPGQLRLRVADFAPLQPDFGSVRLGFTPTSQSGPMPPILLTRDGSRFSAVSAECTHQGCLLTLQPFSMQA
jgi:Rieske Fe-S protein